MGTSGNILIIDDDPDAISYLEAILQDNGYETVSASDGAEGLRKARETHPRLILLDLMMPGESGIKFLNKIREDEKLKGIPVIVQSGARQVTGVDMQRYLEKSPFRERKKEALGVDVDIKPDAYLEKPIKPSDLLATVKKYF
jgi:CheY-like chemotaxis protein